MGFILVPAALWLGCIAAFAQNSNTGKLNLSTGRDIYLAACVGCHGPDGKGQPDTTLVFDKPKTFPDFSACDQTTPEYEMDWKATITEGGHGRGFSPIMPSFSEALTSKQIDLVVKYLRSLCHDPKWPLGELNLPRAIATEKAFPEDEVVITTSMNAQYAPGNDTEIAYEHRIGVKNQLEAFVPFAFTHDNGRWVGGFGDIGLGLKRILLFSNRTGSIFSVQGSVIAPTGSPAKGTGNGTTSFETFASFGQIMPANFFFQGQMGADQPVDTSKAPKLLFWRASLGKSFRQGQGIGRLWSPMVEFLADRDLETGAKTNWDILPEFQVTISKRQHVRFNLGVRIPATNTVGRPVQVVFYFLWDWFDGGLLEGWK